MDAAIRQDVLLRLAVEGDLRFISHRDTVRMLERALARSALPVAHSQGFNPHAKLSLPVPRPVGVTAEDDVVVVQLTRLNSASDILARLQPQLPRGARIIEVIPLESGRRIQLRDVRYELELHPDDCARVAAKIREFLHAPAVVIARGKRKGKSEKLIDLRPFVENLRIAAGTLVMTLKFIDNHTAAPRDVLTALSVSWEQARHKVHRKKIGWQ